jgi:hypothetical protein
MNFESIFKYLLTSPKIRRNYWLPSIYLEFRNNIFYMFDSNTGSMLKSFSEISLIDKKADDWEFFENKQIESKSLYHLKPIDIKNVIWGLTHITEFLILASSEKEAREIAKENATSSESDNLFYTNQLWLLSDFVSCEKVSEAGNSEVIMVNFSNP